MCPGVTRRRALSFSRLQPWDAAVSADPIVIASWVIETYLVRNESIMDEYAREIFPIVLKDNTRVRFLLDEYRPKPSDSIIAPRISLCLALLDVGRSKSLIAEDGKHQK